VREFVFGLLALPLTAGLVACSGGTPAASQIQPSREAVERSAHELDVLASNRQDSKAWEFYSQRCKNIIGSLENYSRELDLFFRGRSPHYESATARVNGSSAQVVSIDNDPSAPASAMQPRTWTFIDGRWQFDNC
jgi:serine/threonine-protein kinase